VQVADPEAEVVRVPRDAAGLLLALVDDNLANAASA
jgi:hypothetical protein